MMFVIYVFVPSFVLAAGGVIPCDGGDSDKCDFTQLVSLVQNILNFFLVTAPIVAAALFAYGGFLYFTAAGDQGKIKQAHKVFGSAVFGLVLVLAAWLVIYTVMSGLGVADDGYWFLAK
ncbi:MAG: hypothetical protein HGA48_03865 [Candidatus Yonathbacteria bacterium]|nr:hypothetical protein [Candidatus Yonathbacteria bacterium]